MGASGEVDKDSVLRVLRANSVSVSHDQATNEYTISKGDLTEVHVLSARLSRRMVHYFARKYDIHIHLFYNPPK